MNADGIILFYVVSKCLYLRQLHKTKKTDDNSRLLCILLIQAEGTGFELQQCCALQSRADAFNKKRRRSASSNKSHSYRLNQP